MKTHSLFLAAALTLTSAPSFADEVVIKLATVAPKDSSWDKALRELAKRWKATSGETVKLKIFSGGTQGDEGDMVKKMRVGQLQAAAISAVGLHDITPEPQILATPRLVRDQGEYEYVMGMEAPKLEAAVAAKGFIVLTWSEAGFVYFFTKDPAPTVAALQPQPIFAWSGDPASEQAWRDAGMKPVVVSSTDMVTSLQTGMIKAFSNAALISQSIGWYKYAKNMTDLTWGILPGAVVVEKKAWDKIPAEMQAKLLADAHEVGVSLSAELRTKTDEAKAAMVADGLNVVKVTAEAEKDFVKSAEASYPTLRKGSPDMFDAVKKDVADYRAGKRLPSQPPAK
jgi:TRAP-type C4-dicarboxylate transport system substrate-binding protein